MSQTDTGFADRLAFVRWIRALGKPGPETDRELAKATGVTEAWLYKWKASRESPDSREHSHRFADGLKVDRGWLLDGAGDPPDAQLWKTWIAVRAQRFITPVEQDRAKKAAAAANAKKGRRAG